MKSILTKVISVFLVCIMLLSAAPAFVFAADFIETEKSASFLTNNEVSPTFNVSKINETASSLTVGIELKSGSFLCFDAELKTGGNLICTGITFSDDYKDFINEIEEGGFLAVHECNPLTGIIGLANTASCNSPMLIAVYTFTKSNPTGTVLSDVNLSINSCYISSDDADVEVTAVVTSDFTATHSHITSGEWITTEAATCTKEGTEVRYCSECGELAESRTISMLDHDTYVDRKEATCTEDGYIKTYCHVCNQLLNTETLPATGHLHTRKEQKAATCTEAGYIRVYCTDCTKLLEEKILDIKDHTYVTEQKDATCTENGYIKILCSGCGKVGSSVVIKSPGHIWSEWKVVKEATYRSTGLERRTCKSCHNIEEREIPMIVIAPTDITISMSELTMQYKKSSRLYANVLPEEAAFSADIAWSSSNPKVVTVDEYGNIYAAEKGTATITASTADGKITAECKITVTYSTWQWIIMIVLFGWIWY